jgi:hypothetical protein
MTTGTSTPMSSSMTSAMPSTPSANCTPKSGIQANVVVSWKRAPSASKATVARTASTSTTRLTPSASCLASSSRPRGSAATTAAPTAGSAIMTSRNGKSLTDGHLSEVLRELEHGPAHPAATASSAPATSTAPPSMPRA